MYVCMHHEFVFMHHVCVYASVYIDPLFGQARARAPHRHVYKLLEYLLNVKESKTLH